MSSFTPEQEQEIAVLIRRVTEQHSTLIRQLQGQTSTAATGDVFPTAQPAGVLATRTGFLVCDGAPYDPATFPDLYAMIGTTWNYGGEPPGTFRVPDFRQRMPLGEGASAGLITRTLGQYGGFETAQLPAHNHGTATGAAGTHSHTVTDSGGFIPGVQSSALTAGVTGVYVQGVGGTSPLATTADGSHTHNIATDGVTPGGKNVPPFIVVNWIVKT